MAKFYGLIGFVNTNETDDGVWTSDVVEKPYTGDILRNVLKQEETEHLNDDITISNRISIVSNSFANANLSIMRYVKWMGASWKILSIDIAYPRLILSIGGVYNGPTA